MEITYSDGSYINGTTYYDVNGNPIGTVDAEGNIWSSDGNNTFMGNSLADGNGLPSGGSVASSETSSASGSGTSTPAASSSGTAGYVQDAVAGLGSITNLVDTALGKSPAKTTTTGAKPATPTTGITTYFGIGIVVVLIIAVVAYLATEKKKE